MQIGCTATDTIRSRPLSRLGVLAIPLIALALAGCDERLSGTYAEVDGLGSLEFRGDRVYVTTAIVGTTYAADYEVQGDQVIVHGLGGPVACAKFATSGIADAASQYFTIRDGRTLDGNMGLRFVKQ